MTHPKMCEFECYDDSVLNDVYEQKISSYRMYLVWPRRILYRQELGKYQVITAL